MKPKLIFIVGPTATGKSAIAAILAKKIKAEIISCDSMQIYKQLDIITSKPGASLRKAVKHHLIDFVPATRDYDVSKFRRNALIKIKQIIAKGKIPVLAGGTGLYISVLIDGIFKLKTKSDAIRKRLLLEAEKSGSLGLYKRLEKIDPEAAFKIHPNDTRRIVRALEVFESCGKNISELKKKRSGLSRDYDLKIFGLDMERKALYRRIEERIEEMFSKGLLDEVKKLLRLKLSRTARAAIGIRELEGYFDGAYDLEEAKRLMKRNTRQYAKRQLTWFRKDKRIEWVKIASKENAKEIARKIWKKLCL